MIPGKFSSVRVAWLRNVCSAASWLISGCANQLAFRFPFGSLAGLGLALSRLPVPSLSTDVRGTRHQLVNIRLRRSSAQDASTQSSWTILPSRRIRSKKRSRTPHPRLDIDDSRAGPPSRLSPVNADLLFCAPHALRVLLASRSLLHWKCCMTAGRTAKAKHPTQVTNAGCQHRPSSGPIHNACRTGCEPFPKPASIVLPVSRLTEPKPPGSAPSSTLSAISRITSIAFLCSSGTRAQRVRTPRRSLRQPVDAFMLSSSKKEMIVYHMSRTTSTRTPTATTAQQRHVRTWRRCLPHLRSLLKQRHMENGRPCCSWTATTPSIADSPTITFCSLHTTKMPRNVMHQPLYVFMHMVQHGDDLIGGDFNMSAFSTVGDVFSDPEFSAPGNALLWGAGGLDETCKVCTGFLIITECPYTRRVDAHGRYKFDNAELGLAPRDQTAHFPCLPSPPRHQPPGPRQDYAQSTSSATTPGACCGQKRPQTSAQATCTASRLVPSGHAAQVQSLTEPHTTSTAAFWPVPSKREDSMLRLPCSVPSALRLRAQCQRYPSAFSLTGIQHLPLWQHLECPVEHISVMFSCALDLFLRFRA